MEGGMEQGKRLYDLGVSLGGLGRVLIGTGGGQEAQIAGMCIGCGAAMSGGEVLFHDGSCAACGLWLSGYYGLKAAVFVREESGRLHVAATDDRGRPLAPGKVPRQTGSRGGWDRLWGADSAWVSHRAVSGCSGLVVAAEGPVALRLLLERMGCDVVERPRRGIPLLRSDREGFRLSLHRSDVAGILPGEDALAAAAAWLSRNQAVPAFKSELM